jgi:serine/threonine protein kinase/predicted ATPase
MSASDLIANRYLIEAELGAGAMGRVMLVKDTTNDQTMALKVVLLGREGLGGSTVNQLGHDTLSMKADRSEGVASSLLQFKQEFRLMTQLHHPNCCQVFDYGQMPDGAPYFTMEVVPGNGLDELLAQAGAQPSTGEATGLTQKGLESEQFGAVFPQLLLALGYIHQLGFVHCDLKSANVRLKPDGTVKLMDYGLMEYAGRPAASIRGTLPYLAPEMIKRGPIDQRTDLYSLGCLAYEMLSGRLPFMTVRPLDVLRAHVMDSPDHIARHRPGVDPALAKIVMKLLAKDPIDRFQSASEVLAALGFEPPAGIGGNLLTSPLLGREPEMARLAGLLDSVANKLPGTTLAVWGPSGIGKTRLVEEFRFMVQLDGLACLVGACIEGKQDPYGPFVSIFHQLLPIARELAPAVLAAEAPVLVRILSELGVTPAPALDTGKQEALRLHASMVTLLRAIAVHEGIVLVLEDWHWADASSLEFLETLQRLRQQSPILVLATMRHKPDAVSRLDVAQEMPLASLSMSGLRCLVSNMLGCEDLESGFLEQLATITEGNPFFVERVLEHVVKTGVLRREKGRWNTEIALDDRLPGTLRALLLEKLQDLPEGAGRLARALAVIGRPAPLNLVGQMAKLADDALLTGIHELELAKIVTQNAQNHYHFVQAQFRQTLYGELDATERKHLHGILFDMLERAALGRPLQDLSSLVVTEIAQHGLQAQFPQRAIFYAYEAAQRHARVFGMVEAERLLTTGLALVEAHIPPDQRAPHFSFLRSLGEVKRQMGQAPAAAVLLERALKTALDRPAVTGPLPDVGEEPGHSLVPANQVGRLLTSLAKAYQVQGKYDLALAKASRAVEVCGDANDPAGAARAALTVARVRFYQGQGALAVEDAEQALLLAREGSDKGIMGLAHAFLGYLYVSTRPDKLETGVEQLHASLALLLQAGDRPGLNDSYNLLGNAESMLGNFYGAMQAFKESAKVCREIGFREDEAVALVNIANTAIETGDWCEALATAREARTLSELLDAKLPLGLALALEAAALAQLGPLAEARPLAEQAVALALAMENRYLESLVLMQQIEVLLTLGSVAAASAAADQLETLIKETGNQECASRLESARADLAARQGLYGIARDHADRALAAARTAGAKGQEVQALRAKARIQALSERWAEARTLAKEALTLADQLGCQTLRAELLGILGEASLQSGDGQARSHYTAMRETAQATGAPALLAQALFGLAAASAESPEALSLASQASDVLVALAAGLDAGSRADFLAPRERRRIIEGAYKAFGVPEKKPNPGPMGLKFGGLSGL